MHACLTFRRVGSGTHCRTRNECAGKFHAIYCGPLAFRPFVLCTGLGIALAGLVADSERKMLPSLSASKPTGAIPKPVNAFRMGGCHGRGRSVNEMQGGASGQIPGLG